MDPACWLEKRIQAFETKCMRKLLCISYLERKINDRMRSKINFLSSPQEPVLATDRRQKVAWFRHVTGLPETILQGTFEGGRHRDWQRKCGMDNIKEWTSLLMPELFTRASCRKQTNKQTGSGSRLNCPLCLPNDPIGQGT